MRLKRSRIAVLGAAALMLTLTACAPPGQEGTPGVAATVGDVVVTNQQVDDTYSAWLYDTKGKDAANRRQVLTIALLSPALLAKCKELGYPITPATAASYATQWLAFKGVQGTPSEDMITATQGILALYVLANVDPTLDAVRQVSDSVAASAVVSPRSGEYSTDALIDSVKKAMQSAQDQQLGSQFSFTEFQNVSAFTDESRPWFDRGSTTPAS